MAHLLASQLVKYRSKRFSIRRDFFSFTRHYGAAAIFFRFSSIYHDQHRAAPAARHEAFASMRNERYAGEGDFALRDDYFQVRVLLMACCFHVAARRARYLRYMPPSILSRAHRHRRYLSS